MNRVYYPQVSSAEDFASLLNKTTDVSTGVPDSVLGKVIENLSDYIPAPSEEHAFAIAFGAAISGKKPVVMIQNSGLGKSIDAILGLQGLYNVGLFMLIVSRGELEWEEIQHQDWGDLTIPMLKLLNFEIIDFQENGLDSVEKGLHEAYTNNKLIAVVIHRGNLNE